MVPAAVLGAAVLVAAALVVAELAGVIVVVAVTVDVDPGAVAGVELLALVEPLVHPATTAAVPPINSARREVLAVAEVIEAVAGETG